MNNNKNILIIAILVVILIAVGFGIIKPIIDKNNFIKGRIQLAKYALLAGDEKKAQDLLKEVFNKYGDIDEVDELYRKITNNDYQDILDELRKDKEEKQKEINITDKNDTENETNTSKNSNSKENESNSSSNTYEKNDDNKKDMENNSSTTTIIDKTDEYKEEQEEKANEKYNKIIEEGKEALENGDYEKALEKANEAIKENPDRPEGYKLKADTYYEMDKENPNYQTEIISNYEMVTKKKENDVDSYIRLGEIYFMNEMYDEAEENYKKAKKYDPNNEQASEGLLKTYIKQGEDKKAEDEAKKLLQINPENKEANKYLGKKEVSESDYTKAEEYLEKAYDQDPSDKETIILLAKTYYVKRKYTNVLTLLETSIKKQPKYKDEYLFLGLAYWKKGQKNQSLNALKTGTTIEKAYDQSYHYKIWYNYGLKLKESGRYNDATVAFAETLKVNSKYYSAYEQLGAIYTINLQKYDNAIKILKVAIQYEEGQNYTNFYNLAISYKYSEDQANAIKYFKEALDANKKTSKASTKSLRYSILYTELGIIYNKSNSSLAYNYFMNAVNNTSPYIETYSGILAAIVKDNFNSISIDISKMNKIMSKSSKAKYAMSKNVNFKNEKGNMYIKAGLIYSKLGDYNNSLKYGEEAIEILGNNNSAYDIVISASVKLGKNEKAIEYINIYLTFCPESKKNELLEILDDLS